MDHEHNRGNIKDNALKAVVTSKLFTIRVIKAKKGKGSYNRKTKHKGKGRDCFANRQILAISKVISSVFVNRKRRGL